jgi:hypothetical protein
MNTLPTLPPVADMSLRELRAELAAHGYEANEIAEKKNALAMSDYKILKKLEKLTALKNLLEIFL